MKAQKTDEELTRASYRIPKKLLNDLEELAIQDRRSINDELIFLLEKGINEWRREVTVTALKVTIADIAGLQRKVEEYAAKRSISVGKASEELGITSVLKKILPKMEAIRTAPLEELDAIVKSAEQELAKPVNKAIRKKK
jgi:hypothetical protein